jgi:hypothetical protein
MPTNDSSNDSFGARWNRFWFSPSDELVFTGVRIAVGALTALWLLSFFGQQTAYFGFSGWLDAEAYAAARGAAETASPENRLPVAAWSPAYLASSPTVVHGLYFGGVVVACLLAAGVATTVTAPLTWLVVATFTSNPILQAYGGNSLLLLLTFYLAVGVLLERWLSEGVASHFALRLLQVHAAMLIFASALGKLQNSLWWEGIPFWFYLHRPYALTQEAVEAMRGNPSSNQIELFVLSLAAYLTVFWQLSFPFLAFRREWKWWIVGGGVFGLIGSWWIYGLPMFGPTYLILTLGFLPASDWRRALTLFRKSEAAAPETVATVSRPAAKRDPVGVR